MDQAAIFLKQKNQLEKEHEAMVSLKLKKFINKLKF